MYKQTYIDIYCSNNLYTRTYLHRVLDHRDAVTFQYTIMGMCTFELSQTRSCISIFNFGFSPHLYVFKIVYMCKVSFVYME
jgi:hypothetical protein